MYVHSLVSAATGMLEYIVVNTVVGGQACLDYLRDNNIGRGNFLALDKVINSLVLVGVIVLVVSCLECNIE
mgnify:CR=1 FL=1